MDQIDNLFKNFDTTSAGQASTIVCLFTGGNLPSKCAPMPRMPMPPIGMRLDINFPAVLAEAVAQNPAIHDGAIMAGRRDQNDPYRILGWSFRLFPDEAPHEAAPNRGSAFNSCLAMSVVPSVDRIYLMSERRLFRFKNADFIELETMAPVF